MTERSLRRQTSERLEELLENEVLTDEQFTMVQAEIARREMEGYLATSIYGVDGSDNDLAEAYAVERSYEPRWDLAEG